MTMWRRLAAAEKDELVQRVGNLISERPEITFACVHGSFLDPELGFRDIDVAVWVDASAQDMEATLEYEWRLSSWLERNIPHPIDAKVLNHSSLGFRHAASGGALIWAKDPVLWYDFREKTWEEYLDFAPLARLILQDLLNPSTG